MNYLCYLIVYCFTEAIKALYCTALKLGTVKLMASPQSAELFQTTIIS